MSGTRRGSAGKPITKALQALVDTGGLKADPLQAAAAAALDRVAVELTRERRLPFVALALGASLMGRLDVTDPLAMWVLYFRIAQSITHVISTSVPAVLLRANLFFVQMLIYLWWTIRLL